MLLMLIPSVQCIGVEAGVAELRHKSQGQDQGLGSGLRIRLRNQGCKNAPGVDSKCTVHWCQSWRCRASAEIPRSGRRSSNHPPSSSSFLTGLAKIVVMTLNNQRLQQDSPDM